LPLQFDVVENLNAASRRQYPLLLILQHDRVSSIGSIVVAPLKEEQAELAGNRLQPTLEVDGRRYVAFIEQLAAVPRQALGRAVGSAEAHRYDIVRAIDLLFTGV
jgi:toxin CcdB